MNSPREIEANETETSAASSTPQTMHRRNRQTVLGYEHEPRTCNLKRTIRLRISVDASLVLERATANVRARERSGLLNKRAKLTKPTHFAAYISSTIYSRHKPATAAIPLHSAPPCLLPHLRLHGQATGNPTVAVRASRRTLRQRRGWLVGSYEPQNRVCEPAG